MGLCWSPWPGSQRAGASRPGSRWTIAPRWAAGGPPGLRAPPRAMVLGSGGGGEGSEATGMTSRTGWRLLVALAVWLHEPPALDACGPFCPVTIFTYSSHPDVPLEPFVGGTL